MSRQPRSSSILSSPPPEITKRAPPGHIPTDRQFSMQQAAQAREHARLTAPPFVPKARKPRVPKVKEEEQYYNGVPIAPRWGERRLLDRNPFVTLDEADLIEVVHLEPVVQPDKDKDEGERVSPTKRKAKTLVDRPKAKRGRPKGKSKVESAVDDEKPEPKATQTVARAPPLKRLPFPPRKIPPPEPNMLSTR